MAGGADSEASQRDPGREPGAPREGARARAGRGGRGGPDQDAQARQLLGSMLLVCAVPVAFVLFDNSPGLHLTASVVTGSGSAAVLAAAALAMLWPVSGRRQRGCAIGCAVFAMAVPLIAIIGLLAVWGLAGS